MFFFFCLFVCFFFWGGGELNPGGDSIYKLTPKGDQSGRGSRIF